MQPGFVFRRLIVVCLLAFWGLGCGSTQQREATEQLLTSNAVDRSISQIDFRALSGQTVYFDTKYLQNIKGVGFVNAEYITSSLRQQLVAARCLLRDKREDADFVVEARIGTLGTDRHEVTYGMPANNFLSAASSLVPNSPPLPTLPELSVAKRNEQLAAAKIGAFAYHRETGEPVWQSGIAPVRSTAKDVWVLGVGPIQRGEIYDGTQFAGTRLGFSTSHEGSGETAAMVDYNKPAFFKPRYSLEKPITAEEEGKPAENKEKSTETKTAESSPPKPAEPKSQPPAPPQAAVADEKPQPKTSEPQDEVGNPLKTQEDDLTSGLRLRFRFDSPAPQPVDQPTAGQLFRLDPPE